MSAIALVIVTVAVSEFALRLPFQTVAKRFIGIFPRALRTIRSERVSEHWKEKALLKLAKLSLLSSFCAAGAIFGVVALFIAAIYGLGLLLPTLQGFALSVEGIALASVVATLYLVARSHAKSRLQRR